MPNVQGAETALSRMARNFTVALTICLCALFAAGCDKGSMVSLQPRPKAHRQALLIGLLPEQGIFQQLARYEPLDGHLSTQIGADITLIVVPRYENVLSRLTSPNRDAAFFESFSYVLAHAGQGVRSRRGP